MSSTERSIYEDSEEYPEPESRPYSGTASRLVGYVPRKLQPPIVETGGMVQLLGKVLWSAVRHPKGYWVAVLDHMFETLRQSWFPLIAAIGGFIIYFSLVTILFFNQAGATELFPPLLLLQSTRSFTVWVIAMVVAGVIGAALTADLGARTVREEIEAMEVMGIDPFRDLVVPRVVSVTILTGLIAIPAVVVTALGQQLAAFYYANLDSADFYSTAFDNLYTADLIAMVGNCFLLGFIISTVCAYKGLNAGGGPVGLGQAVNQAVVVSYVAVWSFQLLYNAVALGLLPNLGKFR